MRNRAAPSAQAWLERAEIPYALQSFMGCTPVPYMVYSDAVLPEPPGVRHEWWIYSRLAEAAGLTMFGKPWLARLLKLNTRLSYASRPWLRRLALTPEKMISGMLGGKIGPIVAAAIVMPAANSSR